MSVTQDYKSPTFSLPERIEIRTALEMREKALREALKVMAADKNPRAFDALKAAYTKSLAVIAGLNVKVVL